MDKIVLIDGHSILNRAFYGVPKLTNAEGLHTNAIYGFLSILFKTLEEEKPAYLTVVFDVSAPTFRHEMYEAYKGTRKPMPLELKEQVPVMKEVLHAMGIQTLEKAGLEADDLLGTLSVRLRKAGLEVVILSGDKDLLQLAEEHVTICIPSTRQGRTETKRYSPKQVGEQWQVTPKEFIDIKALMGDSSDNIPGIPGIGEKTAIKIISAYGSIENAYAHAEELKPPRVSAMLREHYELAKMSKKLATILVEADFSYELKQAKLGNLYTKEAQEYFVRLQFRRWLNRFSGEETEVELFGHFQKVTTKQEAEKIFIQAKKASHVGVAPAKEQVLPLFVGSESLAGIGLCFGAEKIFYLEAGETLPMSWVLEEIRGLLQETPCFSVANLKEKLKEFPVPERKEAFDFVIAAYLLNPLKSDYDWQEVAMEYLSLLPKENMDTGWARSCYEAYTAYQSMPVLRKRLEEAGMWRLFADMEMPLTYALYRMEQAGMRLEKNELATYAKMLGKRIADLQEEIFREAGESFNINSPKQLGGILFEKMGMPHGKKTKTGYSTSASVLEKLAIEYPFVNRILEYRQLTKLKSTYADGLLHCVEEDGRVHSVFHQTVTATGRISSTEPNLQNIPVRMELGRLIRKVFVPEEGYVFVDADYSQVELRILAHLSGDDRLIEAYRQAKDIHGITASQVFHIPFTEVTELQRRNAKAVNFGIVYGISSFGLSQGLSISREEAKEYIDSYFETYPGVKRFLDTSVSRAKEQGYVTTLFGRRRPVPELASGNFVQRSFGERVAMNSPIQGTAADIMKLAMLRVERRLREEKLQAKIVLQVHDELLVEVKREEAQRVKEILQEEMEQVVELSVALEVDVHEGNSWFEAK